MGIGDFVTIKNAEYHDKRFGLLSPEPKFQTIGGEISLKPNKISVSLNFKKHPFDLGIELDAHMYSTPFKLYEIENLNRFRLKSELLEIISEVKLTDDDNLKTTANFLFESLEKVVSFDTLKKYMALIKLFEENNYSLILEVRPLDFPVCMKLNLTGQGSFFEDYSDFSRIVNQFSSICQSFRLAENKINLYPVDLIYSASNIKLMYDFLNYAPYKVHFSGEAEDFNIVEKNCYAKVCGFKLGKITLIFYVAFVGKIIEVASNQYELVADEVIPGHTMIKENHLVSEELVSEELEKFMQDLENMSLSPFWID